MQKIFYYLLGLISVITGLAFIYNFFTGNFEDLRFLAMLGIECCFSTVLFIMLEPRPRKTEAQIRHDDRIKSQGLGILVLVTISTILLLIFNN